MSDNDVRRDERLAEVLEQTRDEYRAAGRIDLASWQARYPDLADELPGLLHTLRDLETAVQDCRAGTADTCGGETAADVPAAAARVESSLPAPWPPAPTGCSVPAAAARVEFALPGRLGRYEARRHLGDGGMGIVYKAHDPQLGRDVAIKVPCFKGPAAQQDLAQARFRREARAAAAVRHPHVCPIYDVGDLDGVPYAVMAFIEGTSLAELAAADPIEPRRAAEIVRQVAEGLAAVHAHGIVHRDLKPANVLLDAAGQALLADFGLARWDDGNQLTAEGALAGTPAYMAPEQASLASGEIGPWTDIYSLGVVLYELLTGRPPFRGNPVTVVYQVAQEVPPPPSQLRPDLDSALEAIVLQAMARRPQDRYPSATAFAEALANWLSGEAEGTSPPPTVPVLARRAPRRFRVALAAGVLFAAVTLAGVVIVIRDRQGKVVQQVPVPPGHTGHIEQEPSQDLGGAKPPGDDPLAVFARKSIPAAERFDWQPKELVAVYGTHRWKYWGLQVHAAALTFADNGQDLLVLPAVPVFGTPHRIPVQEAATGKERFPIERPNLVGATYSAEGRITATMAGTADDWTVEVRDTLTQKQRLRVRGSGSLNWQSPTRQMHLDPGGRRFALTTTNGVRIWDLPPAEEGKPDAPARERTSLDWLPKQVGPVAFSADGKGFATSEPPAEMGKPWTVKVWDLEAGKVRSVPGYLSIALSVLAFSPDGRLLVGGLNDGSKFFLWDADTGKPAWKDRSVQASALAFSPDSTTLALCCAGAVTLYDSHTGQKLRDMARTDECDRLLFSPDGKRLAGSNWRNIYLWDASTGKRLGGPDESVDVVDLSHDGKTLALRVISPEKGQVVRIIDLTTGKDRCVVDLPSGFSFGSGVLAADGRTFATRVAPGGGHGYLGVWDVSTAAARKLPAGQDVGGSHWVFSPNGNTLVSLHTHEPAFVLWSTKDWKSRVEKLPQDILGKCGGLAISPDSKTLAIGTTEKGLLLFDLDTGKQRKSLVGPKMGHEDPLAFTRDGKHLLGGETNWLGRIWDVETGKGTPLPFFPTASGPDGSVFGYNGGAVCRWSKDAVQAIWQAPGLVSRVELTLDGRCLFANNGNGTVYVLRLAAGAAASN